MRVKDLHGKEHNLNLGKYVGKIRPNCSSLHLKAREFLRSQYPALQILEEVYIPGEDLYLDFYVRVLELAVEVQGKQHQKHVSFFHKTKLDFGRAKNRDSRKREWCELNGIKLVEFFDEDTLEWEKKLK